MKCLIDTTLALALGHLYGSVALQWSEIYLVIGSPALNM